MTGLIVSILVIMALFTYFQIYFTLGLRFLDFELIFGILLVVIAIISSFYVNKNSKNGSILLIIIGILIFLYSAGIPHIQFLENGDYILTDFTYTNFNYLIKPWDVLSLAGILLSFLGISNIEKKL